MFKGTITKILVAIAIIGILATGMYFLLSPTAKAIDPDCNVSCYGGGGTIYCCKLSCKD
jgi:hypothetical protein